MQDVSTLSVLCGKQLEQSVVACRYRTVSESWVCSEGLGWGGASDPVVVIN